ncbi:MAG TPA: hypothetical protein VFJ82_23715 [Longimicrobium sp.]|nr:hypothetical protein [Longimicrobium sp.]
MTQLVYYEQAGHPQVAIAREKELKWRRARKVAPVSEANPTWREDAGFFTSIRLRGPDGDPRGEKPAVALPR